MTNKQYLQTELSKLGWELGCCTKRVEKLGKRSLNRILQAWAMNEATELVVTVEGKKYVCMLDTVDNEKDITMLTLESHKSQFGSY